MKLPFLFGLGEYAIDVVLVDFLFETELGFFPPLDGLSWLLNGLQWIKWVNGSIVSSTCSMDCFSLLCADLSHLRTFLFISRRCQIAWGGPFNSVRIYKNPSPILTSISMSICSSLFLLLSQSKVNKCTGELDKMIQTKLARNGLEKGLNLNPYILYLKLMSFMWLTKLVCLFLETNIFALYNLVKENVWLKHSFASLIFWKCERKRK